MDYFPSLKEGIANTETCYMIIIAYGFINNFIGCDDIGNGSSRKNIITKIFNSYVKSLKITKINIL